MGENGDRAVGADAATKGRETGRLLAGRYRLGGVQGRGGMGTVWRAEDEILSRTVAVKELRFPSDIDEDEKRRLITRTLREAKAIARIRSGSAVTVFDVVDEDDRPWIVMELVEGRSLADVIREDGPLEPRRAAEVGLSILAVLRAAHREGIVHRDVKPSNVLIEEETGRVVLTDFGIAKVEGDPSVTSTGMLVGAPSYISPERARGQLPGPPADMWSLGGLLYAAVEGHPPYDKGSAIATLTAVMTDPLEPPQNAGGLEEAIYGLLLKDPEKRLDNAGARPLLEAVANAPEEPADKPGKDTSTATATVAIPAKPPAASTARMPSQRPGPSTKPAASVRTANASGAGGASKPGDGGGSSLVARLPAAWRQRGAVIAVVAVVVLGVLGAVLAFALNGSAGDSGNSGKDNGSAAGGAAGGQAEQDGQDTADGKNGDDGKQDASEADSGKADGSSEDSAGNGADEGSEAGSDAQDSAGKGSGDSALPEGYAMVTDEQFRFSMAMPKDWSRVGTAGVSSGGKYGAAPDSLPRIQVDFSNSPRSDAVQAWRLLEAAVAGASTDYKKLDMRAVQWRDYPTVSDWEFERTQSGARVRVLNRGFKVDGSRGYAIMITCKASEWDGKECATLRDTAFDTFKPAG
ncbi:protein kinase [Streptomyces sp. 549]|uniref:serine/threonine protein kinase n=1 Tax=Streptomyces sp. 549 TaxID=3049076 RepID=UPI0024C38246|nr:serine/threonine protein kinase [Streptomyces sp. 549]MDK1472821.1 protein kinase [Streptomyces sp. 549]